MINPTSFAALLERFFTQRLMQQRQASPHTISSYRDTFRQFLKFIQKRLHKLPSRLSFEEIDAPLIVAFLGDLEKRQGISVRSRNLRLTAIHSFFRYAAFEAPANSAQIQRVLAIPRKRFTRTLVPFLTRPEVDALLVAPDQRTWSGRRDHAFLLVVVQTGLRLHLPFPVRHRHPIERLVQAIEQHDSPAFRFRQTRAGYERVEETRLSRYFTHIRQMMDLFDDWVECRYSEHLQAFREACQDI